MIGGILNDFMRVTQDHYPYHFYGSSKTVAYTVSLANEKPVASVKLIGSDGKKDYKIFRFHALILESQYPNVYFGGGFTHFLKTSEFRNHLIVVVLANSNPKLVIKIGQTKRSV